MKNKGEFFTWENGVATCTLSDGVNTYVGVANCHPDDQDMCSEKVGCTIAERRAIINYWRSVRKNEIIPTLKAYNALYYSINKSKNFNPKSYEAKMLVRKIKQTEFDLQMAEQEIKSEQKYLREYIDQKDLSYRKIRSLREDENK